MMATMTWQQHLYPHTFGGADLRDFVGTWRVWMECFDDEDRRVMGLVRAQDWATVAKAVHSELRSNLAIGRGGDPVDRELPPRLRHPVRRIMRPKKVLIYNRNRGH